MTDNEIIKALECCSNPKVGEKCPRMKREFLCTKGCMSKLVFDALDLINRQKAEIERLQNESIERIRKTTKMVYEKEIAEAKSEAIKEFAERFREKASGSVVSCQGYEIYETKQYQMSAVDFDNLVAEMTEQKNEGKE